MFYTKQLQLISPTQKHMLFLINTLPLLNQPLLCMYMQGTQTLPVFEYFQVNVYSSTPKSMCYKFHSKINLQFLPKFLNFLKSLWHFKLRVLQHTFNYLEKSNFIFFN